MAKCQYCETAYVIERHNPLLCYESCLARVESALSVLRKEFRSLDATSNILMKAVQAKTP